MLIDRDGVFHAYPAGVYLAETGPNKLATCVIHYRLFEEVYHGQVAQLPDSPGYEITGYHYLEKRDGGLNDIAVNSLVESLGWDGVDLSALNSHDYSATPVQIVVRMESYDGRVRARVAFLNPYGSGGTAVTAATPHELRGIAGRLSGKLLKASREKSGPVNNHPEGSAAAPPVGSSGSGQSGCDVPF